MDSQLSGEAIVLKRIPFKEFDLLVYLYTKERGLIKVIAKGAKKFNSKLAAHLEPISIVNYLCLTHNSPYKLVSVNNLNYFIDIRENLVKQNTVGLILNYFLKIVKENEKDWQLYFQLKQCLVYFDQVKVDKPSQSDAYLIKFLVKFLDILGFAIRIKNCCLKADAHKFSFQAGTFVCPNCRDKDDMSNFLSISKLSFQLLYQLIREEKDISFTKPAVAEIKVLLLKFLDYNHNFDKY
jgi:DNA repair protein RecO (recombination protein O)